MKDLCSRRNPDMNAQTHNAVQLSGMTFETADGGSVYIVAEYECLNCGRKVTTKLLPA